MTPASLTAVARHLDFVRETLGPNRGYWVEFLQRFTGGVPGDSWCADFVSFVLDIAYLGRPPLHRTGSTQQMLNEARTEGWTLAQGSHVLKDDLYFFVRVDGIPHHIGIVTIGDATGLPLTGIAGNTSTDGISANGVGVFEHILNVLPSHMVIARLPK